MKISLEWENKLKTHKVVLATVESLLMMLRNLLLSQKKEVQITSFAVDVEQEEVKSLL